MKQVKLITLNGDYIAEVTIPPFPEKTMPKILLWGVRFFIKHETFTDTYIEEFGIAVVPENYEPTKVVENGVAS